MKNSLLMIAILASISSFAQSKSQILEALNANTHQLDKQADYSYLVNACKIHYNIPLNWDVKVFRDYHQSIKIYNESGLSKANITIRLVKGDNRIEKVEKLNVIVHKKNNGNISSNKVDVQKYIEKNESYILYKFSVPTVAVGDVIEMKYTVASPFVTILPRFYFQHDVPVDSTQYIIDVPGYFGMTPNLKGYVDLSISNKKLMSEHYELRYTMNATNLESFKNATYVMNPNDYRASIKYEISSYQIPGRGMVNLTSTWQDVADIFWKDWKFKKSLKNNLNKMEAKPVLANQNTVLDTINTIVDFVLDNYSWNKEHFSSEADIKKMLKDKSGNVIDINLLLINLLRKNNVEAIPLITRLRHYGYINDRFPSRGNFNTIITYVKLANGYLLIDPTDRNLDLGQISVGSRNYSGLLMHQEKDEAAEFIFYDANNIKKKSIQSKYTVKNDNSLSVETKEKLWGLSKLEYTSKPNQYLPEDALRTKPTIPVVRNKPALVEYKIESQSRAMSLENKLILPVCPDCPLDLLNIEEDERDYPILLSAKEHQSFIYQLEIPEGYKIEALPADTKVSNEDETAMFQIMLRENGNNIIGSITYKLMKEVFTPAEYVSLKEMIDEAKEKLEESIVLVKP